MLTLSKQSDYGLMIFSHLLNETEYVSLSKLIDQTNLPQRFLARIAATLVNRGLLISREGRVGGYKIADKARTISLYDYLRIFERNLDFVQCLKSKTPCKYAKNCSHKEAIRTRLNEVVMNQLKATKLIDLFQAHA